MSEVSILTEEFAQAAARAGLCARQEALAAGHPVVYVDSLGRYVEELPDGRRFEIHFEPGNTRESHVRVLCEIPPTLT